MNKKNIGPDEKLFITLSRLRNEKNALENILGGIVREISEVIIPVYRAEYEKKYVETFWKFQNSFSGGKHWYCFAHVYAVVGIRETRYGSTCDLVCNTIEERPDGMIIFRTGVRYDPGIFSTKITKAEYEKKKADTLKILKGI